MGDGRGDRLHGIGVRRRAATGTDNPDGTGNSRSSCPNPGYIRRPKPLRIGPKDKPFTKRLADAAYTWEYTITFFVIVTGLSRS